MHKPRFALALGLLLFAVVVLALQTFPREVHYLALGDSLSWGEGAPRGQDFPSQLAALLRAPPWRRVALRNAAVPGYLTQHVLTRELPVLREFVPDVVTLGIGTNDVLNGVPEAQYRLQVRLVLHTLKQIPGVRVYVFPQGDWSRAELVRQVAPSEDWIAKIQAFNRILREETERSGATFVNLAPLMARQAREGLVAPDGLHYHARAYLQWAQALAQVIKRDL